MKNSKFIKFPNEQETELYDRITKVESKIIDKITNLKKQTKNLECKHFEGLQENGEDYDFNVNYYEKYWKTFLLNELCYSRINEIKDYVDAFNDKLEEIEDLYDRHQDLLGSKGKKKIRRTAEQISKQHTCPYLKCFRVYGTEVSLNLHIKLKHNGGNKSDRQKAAELIWQAKQKNRPIPQFYINLPPGFIEEYGRMRNRNHQDSQRVQG